MQPAFERIGSTCSVKPITGASLTPTTFTGTLFVAPATYRDRWKDDGLTGVRIELEPEADPDAARQALEAAIEPLCDCGMLSEDEFRKEARSIVDGTFYTAYALEAVASFVMAVAVFCFFTMSLDERRSELV